MAERDLPSLGLALSGGAARGIAHIGVLQAFKENGIIPDFLAGTSIGSLVAGLFAFGIPVADILNQAEALSWTKISSLNIPRTGFLSNRILGEIVESQLGKVNIEDSPIPLAIVTTDISNGERVVLREGSLSEAIKASSCIPGIFTPVSINGRLLVDGFLVENVPLSPLREMGAQITVGVNLGALRDYREPDGIIDIMMNAFEIAVDANTFKTMRQADLIISPKLAGISRMDSTRAQDMYDEGYQAALAALPELRRLRAKANPSLLTRLKKGFRTWLVGNRLRQPNS
ncbi:MAG: patatin-like phospholipase family protein [Calditrichaeota bacterium]|nr:patatin-like phospholipase family protein [Calditrichota bacterium]HQU73258.1 patatin-like phospholipase family protein [Calditrichia bacterium]